MSKIDFKEEKGEPVITKFGNECEARVTPVVVTFDTGQISGNVIERWPNGEIYNFRILDLSEVHVCAVYPWPVNWEKVYEDLKQYIKPRYVLRHHNELKAGDRILDEREDEWIVQGIAGELIARRFSDDVVAGLEVVACNGRYHVVTPTKVRS